MKKNTLLYTLFTLAAPTASAEFMRIGHRGACGYAPENTLASFAKAIELGVDAIELDVFRCSSGELVVIHDESVERTTTGKGLVEEQTLTELKRYHAKGTDVLDNKTRIPTLAEVFDLVNKRVIINIELKGANTAKLTAELIHNYVTQHGWSYDRFMVSSFNHKELLEFKKHAPQVKVGALFDTGDNPFRKPLGDWAFIALSKDDVTPEYVKKAHAQRLKIYVYTVNKPEDITRIKAMGVDGIFSNYPDRL